MTLLDYPTALFTADEFDRMAEVGAFGSRSVVLINGKIVEMPAQGERHVISFSLTAALMHRIFAEGWAVRLASPLRTNRFSQPEPDIVILRGDIREYRDGGRPTSAELVIEISDSTLRDDRGEMRKMYAAAGVTEYWIVNLVNRQLEVYRYPDTQGGEYRDVAVVHPGQAIAPLAAPDALVDPAQMLP